LQHEAAAMNDTPTTTTPFWRFSLKYYGQPGVSDACIALQDDCGVDVNLLLFLFWLASEWQELAADEVKKLDATIKSWSRKRFTPSPRPDRSASRPSRRPQRAAMSRLSNARWVQAFPRRPSTFWSTPSTV
jgi:uncharacterized protein (TIGR02444 family)